MKFQLPILILATVAECLPQLGGMGGSAWPLTKTTTVKPLYRSTAKRVILRYGPLELAGKDVITTSSLM
jgi:hypothetical protein